MTKILGVDMAKLSGGEIALIVVAAIALLFFLRMLYTRSKRDDRKLIEVMEAEAMGDEDYSSQLDRHQVRSQRRALFGS